MGRLQDKVAVVVGAGQRYAEGLGNGRATALRFAREGARLLLVDNREDAVAGTREMIESMGVVDCEALVADVTNETDCEHIAGFAVERFGRIDILHNNVGIGRAADGRVTDMDAALWDEIFAVNVRGVMLVCKYVVPVMIDQGGGVITNVSSLASIAAPPGLLAYKSAKAALDALTHSLSQHHARHGIRVNAILPGLIETPMVFGALDAEQRRELKARRDAQVPLGRRMGTAEDIANAALFLASEEARFITGVLLPVDGGQSGRVG